MILQDELIEVGAVESRVRPSVSRPRLVQDQRRTAHVHVGRIHLLSGWEMAELLDDCDEVIVVLPLKEAHHAVASHRRH
jgi:hypothetical protein